MRIINRWTDAEGRSWGHTELVSSRGHSYIQGQMAYRKYFRYAVSKKDRIEIEKLMNSGYSGLEIFEDRYECPKNLAN